MRVEFFSSGELVKGWTGNLAYPKFEPMGHLMSRCAPGVQVLTTAHSFFFNRQCIAQSNLILQLGSPLLLLCAYTACTKNKNINLY